MTLCIAHYFYDTHKTRISLAEYYAFHNSYLQRFSLRHADLPYEGITADLLSSGLLKEEEDSYEFRYPCIYYYFTARALNSRLQQPKYEKYVKDTIVRLASEIDKEDNESILLFLSYFSENPYLRETLLQTARQMFSDNSPADLQTDIVFINRGSFDLTLRLPNKTPRQMRQLIHDGEDQQERKQSAQPSPHNQQESRPDEEQIDQLLKLTTRAFKMIRVMGQIVKNFATSWEGSDKYPITRESYLLGLRVLKKILTLYAQTYDDFLQHVKETLRYKIEKEMLRLPPEGRHYPTDAQLTVLAKATAFLKTWLLTTNYIFAIAKYVGTRKLTPTYKEIMDTDSSLLSVRLIDVAIKLDTEPHLPLQVIKELVEYIDKNNLARAVLKQLAFNRLSLYEAYPKEKQTCCQVLGIKQDDPRLYLASRKIGQV